MGRLDPSHAVDPSGLRIAAAVGLLHGPDLCGTKRAHPYGFSCLGAPQVIYAFDDFELDPSGPFLYRAGAEVDLHPTPLRVLSQLVRHRDRVVTKAELLDRVWGAAVVSDATIASAIKEIRRVLGDDGASQRYVQTLRRRGYRFVAAVEERVEEPAPSETSRGPAALIGRHECLAGLEDALDDLEHGRGRVLLLSGEAGIGKTRIVEALVERARSRGVRAELAWCWPGEGAPPYWIWIQLLRRLLGSREPDAMREALAHDAGVLASLLPELGEGNGDRRGLESLDPQQARFRLFDALASFVVRRSERRPLVLVLEDLHWAGTGSLQLLEFVARNLEGSPLLLLGTHRPAEGASRSEASSLLARLARSPHCEVVDVEGFGDDEVREFVRSAAGLEPSDELVRALRRRTRGNPFLLGELMRSQPAALRDGHLEELETGDVPFAVREAFDDRIAALGTSAREVAELASTLRPPVEPELLMRAAECDASAVERALDDLRRARLLETAPETGGLRFVHDLAREAVYAAIDVDERRSLHGRVADALEQIHASDRRPVADALADHFEKSGRFGAAARYARLAGDRALEAVAFERAVASYERALRCLAADAADEPDFRSEIERGELLLALGRARQLAGHPPRATSEMEEATDLARRIGAGELLARCALARAALTAVLGEPSESALALLEEAMENLPLSADPGLRIRLEARLGEELRYADFPRACRVLDGAVARARRLGDERTLARVLAGRSVALGAPDRCAGGLDDDLEVVRIAKTLGDADLEMLGRRGARHHLLERGDVERLETEERAIRELTERHDVPWFRSLLASIDGGRQLLEGRFEEAEKTIRGGLEAALSDGAPADIAKSGSQLAFLLFHTARWAELREGTQALLGGFPGLTAARAASAIAAAGLGDAPTARRELESITAEGLDQVPWDGNWLVAMTTLAWLCDFLHEPETAAEIERLLRPYLELCATVADVFNGSVRYHLGLLAALLDRPAEAIEHLRVALALHERLGARPWQAWSECALGGLLVDLGGAEAERGFLLLGRAEATAEALGMRELARRAGTRSRRDAEVVSIAERRRA